MLLGHRVLLDLKEHKEPREFRVSKEPRDRAVCWETRVTKELKEIREI